MNTHCTVCGISIYDSACDVCCDCEHKEESKNNNLDWRYQMHRDMAEANHQRLNGEC